MKRLVLSSFTIFVMGFLGCNSNDCEKLKNTEWVLIKLDTILVGNIPKDRDWFIKFEKDKFTFGEKDLVFSGNYSIEGDSLFVEYKITDGFLQNYKTKYEVSEGCDTLILHTDFYRLLYEKFKVTSIYVRR